MEIEEKVDLNKEEEMIEVFIKDKRKQGSSGPTMEVFSLYKLKSKVLNEKIQKIRRQFED